ncbi:MAG: hypothetical protein OXI87_24160 [Albidovulum sp.]|nr:hypothetical protein [Albidovulum sp.]
MNPTAGRAVQFRAGAAGRSAGAASDESGPTADPDAWRHAQRRHDLLAALKVLGGTETGRNIDRLRHKKFFAALDTVDRQLPEGREANVVPDNNST